MVQRGLHLLLKASGEFLVKHCASSAICLARINSNMRFSIRCLAQGSRSNSVAAGDPLGLLFASGGWGVCSGVGMGKECCLCLSSAT